MKCNYSSCIFIDELNEEENIEYIHVENIDELNVKMMQCKRKSIIERMTRTFKNKELVIHACVTTEKGFWTILERILVSNIIPVYVLITYDIPKPFMKRCKIIKREYEIDSKEICLKDITSKSMINRYRDIKMLESYIDAFIDKELLDINFKSLYCK